MFPSFGGPNARIFSQQDTYNLRKTSSRGRPTRRCTGPRKAPESPWLDSAPGAARDPTWKKWVPQGPQGLRAPGGGGDTGDTGPAGSRGRRAIVGRAFSGGLFFLWRHENLHKQKPGQQFNSAPVAPPSACRPCRPGFPGPLGPHKSPQWAKGRPWVSPGPQAALRTPGCQPPVVSTVLSTTRQQDCPYFCPHECGQK